MSAVVVSLADSELCRLLPVSPVRPAAEELMRRYGDAALGCALALCRHRRDAEDLVIESFNRTLDAFQYGEDDGRAWIACLLGNVRRTAAEWADGGRLDALEPSFVRRLQRGGEPHRSYTSALLAAEEDCLLLCALQGLPESPASEVWAALAPSVRDTTAVGTGRTVPAEAARQQLAGSYARNYAARVARPCRHLVATLAHEATGPGPASTELARHLRTCDSCTLALDDLRLVHRWDTAVLRGRMLLPSRATGHDVTTAVPGGHPTTAARFPSTGHRLLASVVPDNDEGPPSAVTVPVAGRPSRSSRRRRRRRDGRLLPFVPSPRRAAVGAAGLGIVAVGLGLAYAQPPTPRASVAPVPTPLTVGPDLPGAGASPSGSGSGSAQPSEPANRPPAPAPTRSMPAATTSSRAPVPSAAPSPPPAPASPTPSAGTSSTEPSPSTTLTPPPAPPAVRILQRGDQGQDVVRLQRLLIRAGYGTATAPLARGSFDAATEAALRTFQHQAGIRGEERDRAVYGPRSRAALERTSATAEG